MPWFSACAHSMAPDFARRNQNVEQGLVVDLQPVIGHEDLDRSMPLLDQRRNVVPQRFRASDRR